MLTKIKLTYNHMTVEINAEGLDASIDAFFVTVAVLDETRKLNYGNPKVEMDTKDLKIAPTPKSPT